MRVESSNDKSWGSTKYMYIEHGQVMMLINIKRIATWYILSIHQTRYIKCLTPITFNNDIWYANSSQNKPRGAAVLVSSSMLFSLWQDACNEIQQGLIQLENCSIHYVRCLFISPCFAPNIHPRKILSTFEFDLHTLLSSV